MQITYGELLATSVRIKEEKPMTKDFELAVSELIQMYRHRITKNMAVIAMLNQATLVAQDGGWQDPKKGRNGDKDEDDEDEDSPDATPPTPDQPEGDQPAA